jgi:hypothetical protein
MASKLRARAIEVMSRILWILNGVLPIGSMYGIYICIWIIGDYGLDYGLWIMVRIMDNGLLNKDY